MQQEIKEAVKSYMDSDVVISLLEPEQRDLLVRLFNNMLNTKVSAEKAYDVLEFSRSTIRGKESFTKDLARLCTKMFAAILPEDAATNPYKDQPSES